MNSTETTKSPSIQRYRSTDATSWFWSLVLVLAGLFYTQIFPIVGILLLLASLFCFIWQFKTWYQDSAINRHATVWCQNHYPSYGGSQVVDFMVALAHDTGCDFTQLTPSTPLDELNRIPEDQMWLADLVDDAKIQHIDLSEFSGTTLHDAIQLVTRPQNAG